MPTRPPAVHRGRGRDLPTLLRAHRDLRAFAAVAAVSLLAAAVITLVLRVAPSTSAAVRDPLAVAFAGDPTPFYTGWVVYLGTTGWFASAAVTLFASRLALRRGARRTAALLTGFSGLSAFLAVDDLFMLHDGLLLRFGVPEQALMLLFVVLALVWGLTFLRDLLGDVDALVLGLSVALFAHSLLSDVAGSLLLHEESTKFAAVICWTAWAWRRSVRAATEDGPVQSPARSAGVPAAA